ncbi:Ribosomal RNA-processing protein-like protein [Hapsidospora chrysogenum ATCC 11550]|uniref:Ribosomal RNA-processing protein-like protein n=1 Tax=Hapsidospora chrysogenum (strain ATCC 11550 / CBS 779.69 / DSM 880 / IAM 14645 / JCM 23072 / IMI 49137) TaxID=857340 RepID=A0A086T327_HAPC1|nr:Ribosomal RNA-processing protein-like protein [Hapsidospora chrysogenum ATCC 11550]
MSGERMLQDRLQHQAGGFDGLLSLIPAKMYYGEDNTNQWKKKKQTKAEAKAARRAKLDPDSELNRNAKEVMEERARNKRKLRDLEQEEAGEDDDDDDDDGDSFEAIEGVEVEKPGQGLRRPKTAEPNNKKLKRDDDQGDKAADDSENEVDDHEPAKDSVPAAEEPQTKTKLSKKEEKKAAKSQKRKEKKAELKARKADKQSTAPSEHNGTAPPAEDAPTSAKKDKKKQKNETNPAGIDAEKPEDRPANHDDVDDDVTPGKGHEINFSGNIQQQDDEEESGPSSSTPQSPTFDTGAPNGAAGDGASASTSVSSTVPPSEKPKHIKIPTDTSNLRARLAARIEALRAARKADGPDGKPIRTRQELIESRRAKQAQRKAHKKELRQKAKLEEERKREEALASNSPSVMSPAVEHPSRADSPGDGGFAFGRVAFGDGTKLSHDLSYVLSSGKRKGPSDPKTALLKVQNQKKRLQELDEEKRRDVAEKDTWLNARRRAEGEKIRDDEGILKKTVKRKEASKRKSEKAWKDRIKGVEHAQKEKQKKREENIKKRREEKLMGKAGKKKGGGGGGKKKPRPGFEGSLGVGGRRK